MHIYTKSGDQGETGLLEGKRVPKDDPRIEAIGAVDELNASLGVLIAEGTTDKMNELLISIQCDLFSMDAQLANPDAHKKPSDPSFNMAARIALLESTIDEREARLPPLKNFILPGGTPFSAHAHLARAICRRAERQLIALQKTAAIDQNLIIYLNRLSDLIFMIAREDMHEHQLPEQIWKP